MVNGQNADLASGLDCTGLQNDALVPSWPLLFCMTEHLLMYHHILAPLYITIDTFLGPLPERVQIAEMGNLNWWCSCSCGPFI